MGLPDLLLTALIEARSITSNIAGRRHRQFIGALMRDVDPEPIRQALLEIDANFPVESERVKETRMWRDKLLTEDQFCEITVERAGGRPIRIPSFILTSSCSASSGAYALGSISFR